MVNDEKYDHVSDKLRDLIRLMLTPNPDKRPNIQVVEIMLENFDKLK